MSGSSSQNSHAPISGEGGGDPADANTSLESPEDIPDLEPAPSASSYLALAVALLAGATLLALALVGVPGTIVHISGVAAMVTSALAMLMTAGALLALRSALAARKNRI